ncbi:MAG TPA: TlpA disulfide reductase family protein [Pyrinomonadaceae bacterium]|nr:TlpA disulfide reductase family protein [Pyrinomonadaceae bacterium]
MTSDQQPRTPAPKVWTGSRLALAALTFALLAVAFSSSCNPSDSSQNITPKAAPPAAANSNTTGKPPARASASTPELTDALRGVEMKTVEGKSLKLSDYGGKVVVLDLWATWCGPCRLEVPELVALQKDYGSRGVQVVGLTIEGFSPADQQQNAAKVRAFSERFQINYTVGWAEQNLAYALMMPSGSIPQTFVLAPDGRVVRHFKGYYQTIGVDLRAAVDEALQTKG